jgi:hypothetical protein
MLLPSLLMGLHSLMSCRASKSVVFVIYGLEAFKGTRVFIK